MTSAISVARRHRVAVLAVTDGVAWVVAFVIAAGLRLDTFAWSFTFFLRNSDQMIPILGALTLGCVAAALHAGLGWVVRLHQGRAMTGSFEEMLLLGGVTGTVGMVVTIANVALPSLTPRSVPIAATFACIVLASWVRALYRRMLERTAASVDTARARPVLIVGAGEGGRQLVQSMVRDPESSWRPVGFLDDDPRKRHLRVRGVPVLGRVHAMADVAQETECSIVVIAVPSAGADFVLRVSRRARAAGLDVKVLPGVNELAERVGIADLRDIDMADALGRRQIDTDVSSIAGYLSGKRVLVTGAGGSIGSELCRQIQAFGPSELLMLDRDESALHALRLALAGIADLDAPDTLLADIRDSAQLRTLFRERRPEVVFHAAALKHVNMLERFPSEAVKTNVWGTLAVLEASEEAGVERFVNVSTDKAADPCNVLGYTKRIAEGLTSDVAIRTRGVYMSVRFGNVLGSRGSVLATFAAQIAGGGPVTVTHPDVTRYFMTIEEAVQLVIQAAAIGRDGEALVLDMGEPIRIVDVAQQLIGQADRPIEIVYTGLKPGEKLHEDLIGVTERDERPVHPLVSHVPVRPVSRDLALDLAANRETGGVVEGLVGTCDLMARSARLSPIAVDTTS